MNRAFTPEVLHLLQNGGKNFGKVYFKIVCRTNYNSMRTNYGNCT